jgi:3-deoxy-7-phosphoheptulonate synthase
MSSAKLVTKQRPDHKSILRLGDSVTCGGKELLLIAGPCSVESQEQMQESAMRLSSGPIQVLRAGAFKPRTSPWSFQGMGMEGANILACQAKENGLLSITEVMSESQLPELLEVVDILQIGSRNMQNFELLKAVGKCNKPVVLKRGLAATLEEFILAAEYIMQGGNEQVTLCERGIRSFDSTTRNVLDLGAVVALKQMTHLPVIVDPSHAAGKHEFIADLSKAAVACGADGLMIECHPQPEKSVSDARQAISLDAMLQLCRELAPIASAVGRSIELDGRKASPAQIHQIQADKVSKICSQDLSLAV